MHTDGGGDEGLRGCAGGRRGKRGGRPRAQVGFQFYAITGKVYGIEESTDLKTWTAVPLASDPNGAFADFYRATAVGVVPAYLTVSPGASRFYRLTVR